MTALAKIAGVSPHTITSRLESGMTVEEAVETPTKKHGVEYDGVWYSSIRALSRAKGVDRGIVENRLASGMSLKAAIETPVKDLSVEYCGKRYKSVTALCSELGLSYSGVASALRRGISIEDAVNCRTIKVVYNGITYSSLKMFCKAFDLKYNNVLRWRRDGKSLDEIVALGQSGSANRDVVYNGKVYSSISELCRELDLNYSTVVSRLRDGWDLKRAVETSVTSYGVSKYSGKVEIDGTVYDSVASACRAFGVAVKTVKIRVERDGMSLADAIKLGSGAWSLGQKVARLRGVEKACSLCDGKYVLLKCAICGNSVLLPAELAVEFRHSSSCQEFEWKGSI